METDAKAGDKLKRKLLFSPFCQYSGSNDSSYLNHIVCMCYNVSYGHGNCLKEVFPSKQQLKAHMRCCKGLRVEAVKEKPATSHAKEASSSSPKKMKHQTKSQQSHSQPDSQTLLPTSSQVSSRTSPCCSGCNKKKTTTTTPTKPHSSGKESGEKCSFSHKHSSKKHKSDKHQKKKKE